MTLDDYEEGLWTPTFKGLGSGRGKYVLAGPLVVMKAEGFFEVRHIDDIPKPGGYPFALDGEPYVEVKECGRPRWWKRLLGYKRYMVSVRVSGRQR